MQNEENKKNDIEDYSKFFEKKKEKKVEIPEKEKRFSFSKFKNFWFGLDKKTRIELIILLIIIAATVSILAFYFSEKLGISELPSHSSSQEAYPQSQ